MVRTGFRKLFSADDSTLSLNDSAAEASDPSWLAEATGAIKPDQRRLKRTFTIPASKKRFLAETIETKRAAAAVTQFIPAKPLCAPSRPSRTRTKHVAFASQLVQMKTFNPDSSQDGSEIMSQELDNLCFIESSKAISPTRELSPINSQSMDSQSQSLFCSQEPQEQETPQMTKQVTKRRKLASSFTGGYEQFRNELKSEIGHIREHLTTLENKLDAYVEL